MAKDRPGPLHQLGYTPIGSHSVRDLEVWLRCQAQEASVLGQVIVPGYRTIDLLADLSEIAEAIDDEALDAQVEANRRD